MVVRQAVVDVCTFQQTTFMANPGPSPPPRPDLSFLTLNLGDLSSRGDAGGTSWRRLSLNSPQWLPYRSFDSAVDPIMQLGQRLWMATTFPITYGDENPDTQFLVHNSISRYVSKLPSMGSQARAIKIALPGHTPYVIANIHGPFSRDQREELDEWLAQLPDLGILMGDFNDCVWGRPSQPTRYWHPLLESGALLDPILAHAPNSDPQNLATHCRGRRLDAVLFSPTA